MIRLLCVCFFLIALPVAAQRLSYWNQGKIAGNTFAFQYENDLFALRDQYYSQGISLACKHFTTADPDPDAGALRKRAQTSGFALEHQVFTPSTIRSDSALGGDHPYSALMRGTILWETSNAVNMFHLGYSASIGFIGPAAFGKEMQTAIHKATDNPRPLGWDYQLPNSLLIDFAFYAKKQLCDWKYFALDGFGQANFGTTNIDLSTGLQLRCSLHLKNAALRFYGNPAIRFVGYDGTLQGALFSQGGFVTIPANVMKRIVSEQEVGIQFITPKWTFSYWYRFQSPRFDSASQHGWGGVSICCAFK